MGASAGASNKRSSRTKATFTLNSTLLELMRAATREGAAASVNAFVVEAVTEKLLRLQADRRRKLLAEAASDPLFLADVKAVQKAFEGTEKPPVTPPARQ
jgi:hypothetical protein